MSRIFLAVLAAAFLVSSVFASAGDLYEADFTGGIVYKFAPDGSYTAIESPAPNDSGIGLIEIYDLSPSN